MTSLFVADGILVVAVIAGVVAWRATSRKAVDATARIAAASARPRPAGMRVRSDWGMVVAHAAFDGEVLEFPIPAGEDFLSIADTIAAIERITEISDDVRWPPRPSARAA